ncbi:MAG: DMT family transporter [Candidatus Helarchaeota archaeon]
MSILIASCLMGSIGIFIDNLSMFSIVSISFFRGIFGIAFLTMFLSIKKDLKNIKKLLKAPKWLLLLGFSSSFCILFYFFAIYWTTFAQAAFLLYTGNVFAILFFKILLKEKIEKINILSFILATIGLLCISEFQITNFNIGMVFGIISGVFLGLNIAAIKKFIQNSETDNLAISWWSLLFLSSLFFVPSLNQFLLINYLNIFILIGLGLIPTALAFTLYNHGIKEDESGDVLILAYAEPLVATLLTIFYQNILPSFYILLGGILILISNGIILFSKKLANKKN